MEPSTLIYEAGAILLMQLLVLLLDIDHQIRAIRIKICKAVSRENYQTVEV